MLDLTNENKFMKKSKQLKANAPKSLQHPIESGIMGVIEIS